MTGTAVYSIAYIGGSSSALTATDNVPYTITPDQQSVGLESPVVTGATSGAGTSASPYILPGQATNQVVTLVFQNSGSNPIKMTGVQDTNSSLTWLINKAQSTCYTSTSILPGATCTIVYNNVLNQTALALGSGLGSSYTENLIVPTVIFADTVATTNQFLLQPTLPTGGTTLYAQATLATITNSISLANAGFYTATVTVQSVLTNGGAYSPLSVVATMENYFTNPTSPTSTVGSCTSIESNNVVTRTCQLSPGATTASGTYAVESAFVLSQSVILHTLFDLSNANQAVGMNTSYISTTIPKESQ